MYRLAILILTLQSVIGHRRWCEKNPGFCQWRHRNYSHGVYYHNRDFYSLSWDMASIDRRIQLISDCSANASETYNVDHYQLTIPLTDFSEEDISVKLKHRVLFVHAVKANDSTKHFSIVKILSEFLKGKDAVWRFDSGQLNIEIPYTRDLNQEFVRSCDSGIDDYDEPPVTIQKSQLDVRVADDGSSETSDTTLSENTV